MASEEEKVAERVWAGHTHICRYADSGDNTDVNRLIAVIITDIR
jgi:hypothetical protein